MKIRKVIYLKMEIYNFLYLWRYVLLWNQNVVLFVDLK